MKGLWQHRGPRRSVCSETPSPAPAQEVAAWSTGGFGSLGRDGPTAHQALPGLKPRLRTTGARGDWAHFTDEAVEACERAPLNPLSLRSSGGEDQEPRRELWDTGHVPTTYHRRALLTGCPQGPGGSRGAVGAHCCSPPRSPQARPVDGGAFWVRPSHNQGHWSRHLEGAMGHRMPSSCIWLLAWTPGWSIPLG